MLLCPNKNHEDWKYAVEKLGEDKTLYLYDLLGQEIPTKDQVDIAISGREPKQSFIQRMNSRIENGMYKQKDGTLIPITEHDNPEVWEIENDEDLVDFKGGKKYNYYTWNTLQKKIKSLIKKYKDKPFMFGYRIDPNSKYTIKSNIPKSEEVYSVYITKGETLKSSIISEVDVNNAIKETDQLVSDVLETLEDKTIEQAIDIVNDLEVSDHIKTLLTLFKSRLDANPGLKIVIDNEKFGDWGEYDPFTNTITLYSRSHLKGASVNLDNVGITLVHELIHAFTVRAFYNNFTEKEQEFAKTIERLYSIAKKQSKWSKTIIFDEPAEWLSQVLTRPPVMKEAMGMKLNLWQRILTSVKKLLGITSVYDHAFNTVVEYISNGTIFTPNAKYEKSFKRSMKEDVHVQDNDTHKNIWEKLNTFSNQFEFNDIDHTYKHLPSGQFYNSTTEMLSRLRITSGKLSEDPEIRENQLARRTRGANIGTVIHGITEANLKETAINIARANGYEYDPIVVSKIEQILKQFKRPGNTILSEVLVADVDVLLAGTIDMIIIDENNQVHLYDFKNKEKGFVDYLKPKKFGGSQLMSDKDRHSFQLSAYSDMFEKMTGLNVASLNVIQLKPTVNNNTVTNIELDKTHSDSGIVTVDYNYGVNTLYNTLRIDQGKSIRDEFNQDKIDSDTRKELDDELKSRIKQLHNNIDELSDKEQIVYKSIESLIHKKSILYRSGKKHEIATQEKLIDDLLAETDVEKQLIKILEYANSSSLRIWSEYVKYKDAGKQLPLNLLYGWKDSVNAFNALLDDQDGLNSLITNEFGFKGGPAYRDLLKTTMEIVAKIKGLYEAEGLDQLVDFLAPFYNQLYAEERLVRIKEYRKKKFNGEIPEGITEEQYVDKYIDENEETLQQRTKTLMRKELKKASKDIGVLTRWIDNLLDTTDPVTAAMVKAFVFADEKSRLDGLENRDDMVSLVRKLEDWYKSNGQIPKSNEEFYGFMLEKIDDKLTGHYITSYTSAMMREYRDIISASKDLETPEQRKAFIQSWLDQNMPLQKELFKNAFWDFIETQYSLGNISDDEFTRLEQNNLYATNKLSIGEMTEKGIINFETGDILGTWLNENTWDYRVPTAKWANPQYEKLSKILNDPTDVRGQFYKYVVKLRREADSMLPFGYRLDTRLPGVVKQNHERIASGQSIGATIRQSISRQLTFQVDDTNRIHEEILDEAGNAKYFLPIHFTGRVTKEVDKVTEEGEHYTVREFDENEQSFDIASIYHKYWTMANDYNTKSDILPQMELAKFMINKRKAIKRDSIGNKIVRKRSKRTGNADTPEEDVTINNTYLAQQVNDWFLSCVYGVEENDAGKWGKVDIGKLLNFINSYTSLNLLGLNVVAGTANVILGETLQRIESFAHEYMTPSDFLYADKFYLRTMKGMIGDIGARDTTGLATHITEQFGIFDDQGDSDMDRRTKVGQMVKMDTLYFTSHLGEQYMQSRFLFGLLANKRAYNSKGEDIGRMLDMYELKDNKLVIKPEVDLVKSKWTDGSNGTKDYQGEFKNNIRGILSRLHGEYGSLGKVAIQRMAIGRMAYLFRHFVVPGFRRRWGKKAYIERLGQFVEGNYLTTGKFVGALGGKIFGKTEENKELQFFNRLIGNLQSFKLSMWGAEWAGLTDHEKANVHRTLYEVGFLILAVVLANIAMNFKGDADDEDDKFAQMYWSFVAYQTYRLQNELLFFTPKLDSAMSIMRSPAASMSFVENIIALSGQIFHPTEVYESGPWKGRPKIMKSLNNMAPGLRQYYRLKDIEVQIPWMQKTSLSGRPEQGEEQYITPTYTEPPK